MAKNIPETEDDFIRMQQEAIRRVRDMQERARRTLEGDGMEIVPGSSSAQGAAEAFMPIAPVPPPEPSRIPDPPRVNAPERPVSSAGQHRAETPGSRSHPLPIGPAAPHAARPPLFSLSLDNDQLLILALIFMLYQDGSDRFLMLALAYILLT